ncbi:hypothetical protein BpHYR1_022721 [Brachionus plicatilis]|uniref:Uncharacterized protein n=1 Tax=Brachionus plicatilis TaxID=10195 RepID=A0A3M7T6Y9_BRAPC|nr:hypothetical protein BpHYR1_022721 [Brachionus plicatilis]
MEKIFNLLVCGLNGRLTALSLFTKSALFIIETNMSISFLESIRVNLRFNSSKSSSVRASSYECRLDFKANSSLGLSSSDENALERPY